MGDLFRYHKNDDGSADYEVTTRNGRHKTTRGQKGGIDYTKHSSGCSLAVLAVVGAVATAAPAVAQAVYDGLQPWL